MQEQEFKKETIEIIGPSFHNKGDYLMFIGIDQHLSSKYYVSNIIKSSAPYVLRRLGIGLSRRSPRSLRRVRYYLASLLPREVRLNWQMIEYGDIYAVLDCSGFQYGDQWENLVIKNLWRADHYKALKKQGKKIIMMPQAFGPFEKPNVKVAMREIINQVDLIFARDKISYEHMMGLNHRQSIINQSPDFSNLVQGTKPSDSDYWKDKVCIVPNGRMLDKTPPDISQNYLAFLESCIEYVRNAGLQPIILIHETYDYKIGKELVDKINQDIPIIDENPQITKGIIGACYAVVSSRYHAIISAMSQAIPTLGTSWAHKYRILYDEYECPECLLQTLNSPDDINKALFTITDPEQRSGLIAKLDKNAEILKNKSRNMWKEVDSILES